ncbi:MAG: ImmA/IrrE family metallo-endopeptidase [Verrucomicrobiae bacterium]|nr:ImmA/IrrE family metallo-endopeptidase [Verrucomicrobiae bacterium]
MRDPNRVRAQAAAFRLLNEIGMPHPKLIEIEDLAMHRNVLVVEEAMKSSEGRLIKKGSNGLVRIKSGIRQEGRKRFTISHELGHWEMHKESTQFICSRRDMLDYAHSPMEVEANTFAAELLMPSTYFRPRCKVYEPSLAVISDLANEFRTTLTATAIRFATETRHPLVVVFSEEGVVRWSYSDPKKDLPYVRTGMAIPRYSSAGLINEEGEVNQMEEFDQADWFPQLSNSDRFGILEQSKGMGAYPFILSLLWLTGY